MNIAKQKEIFSLENELTALKQDHFKKKGQLVSNQRQVMLNAALDELKTYLEQAGFQFSTDDNIDYQANSDGLIIKIRKIQESIDVWMPNNEHYHIKMEVLTPSQTFSKQSGLSQNQEIDELTELIRKVKTAISQIDQSKFGYTLKKSRTDSTWNPNSFVTTSHKEFYTVLAEMFS